MPLPISGTMRSLIQQSRVQRVYLNFVFKTSHCLMTTMRLCLNDAKNVFFMPYFANTLRTCKVSHFFNGTLFQDGSDLGST